MLQFSKREGKPEPAIFLKKILKLSEMRKSEDVNKSAAYGNR